MNEELRTSLEEIRKLTPRLNQATDDLADVARAVESFLHDECKLSLKFSIRVNDGQADDSPYWTALEYTKIGGRFRIAVAHVDEVEETATTKPWAECSRDDKVTAFRHLPDLLNAIARQIRKEAVEMEAAAQAARTILESIRVASPQNAKTVSAAEVKR